MFAAERTAMLIELIRGGGKWIARVCLVCVALAAGAPAQTPLSRLNVSARDPLYTTYAAPLARSEYFVAEAYHHNYAALNPGQPYIRIVSMPKVEKLEHYFRERLGPEAA